MQKGGVKGRIGNNKDSAINMNSITLACPALPALFPPFILALIPIFLFRLFVFLHPRLDPSPTPFPLHSQPLHIALLILFFSTFFSPFFIFILYRISLFALLAFLFYSLPLSLSLFFPIFLPLLFFI